MELGARKLKILQAVIEAYIQTGEPVGSKALCELLDVSVSSATIRNEMASLSELGLLEQPHTSAGRIPTQFGYRLYINELMKPKPLSDEEMRYIDGYLSEYADDPDLLLEKAAEMLAEMTKYAAISTTPTNRDATIQRIQLVQTGPHTAMLVLTTSTGTVKSKLFRTNYLLNSDILRMFSNVLNEKMGSVHLLNVTPDFIKSTAFSIEDSPGDPIITEYISGWEMAKNYLFLSRREYSEVDAVSIQNSGFFEQLTEWVMRQNARHNLPDLSACGGGKMPTGIAVTNSGYIVTNSAGSCKMQLQKRLTYYMPK